jgi:hypothetical protein
MSRCSRAIFFFLLVIAASASCLQAARGPRDAVADKEKARKADNITVAVFDFEADAPGSPNIGKQVADIVSIKLSDNKDGFRVLNRVAMDKILREHELNLTGTGNEELRGKLLGAKLIITGKVAMLDAEHLLVTSHLISTETSADQGAMVIGAKEASVFELALKLSDLLVALIHKEGPKLIGAGAEPIEDPLIGLKRALASRKLPTIALQIREHHKSPAGQVQADRTAQTEARNVLTQAGFTIIDGNDKALADGGVMEVIRGDGFSEWAARTGNLNTCTAQVQIEITDRKSGAVLFDGMVTTRAVDLAENTAAKTALQKAGHLLGLEILRHFEKTIPGGKEGK